MSSIVEHHKPMIIHVVASRVMMRCLLAQQQQKKKKKKKKKKNVWHANKSTCIAKHVSNPIGSFRAITKASAMNAYPHSGIMRFAMRAMDSAIKACVTAAHGDGLLTTCWA